MAAETRRWDVDERGRGVGSATPFVPELDEQRFADAVEYDVVTGVLPGQTHFRTLGHAVRFRIASA